MVHFLMMSQRRHNSENSLLMNALSLSDTNCAVAPNLVMKFSQRHCGRVPFHWEGQGVPCEMVRYHQQMLGPFQFMSFCPHPCCTCKKSMWICSRGAPTVWGTKGDLAGGGPQYCLHLPHLETCSFTYSPIWGHQRWSCKRACVLVIP